jgi:anti-sigma factor RsiW
MLTCDAAEPLIARYADGGLSGPERARLEQHLASCAACRAAADEQRDVAAILKARPPERPSGLAARVSARLDAEAGVFGLANWRAWTLGLAPVAAALMLAAYLGIGASASSSTQSTVATEEWPLTANATRSVLMQPATSSDALLEEVLTGTNASGEGRDVR